VIIFVRLASPNVNMGPYGKTTRVPLSWWVLYFHYFATGIPIGRLAANRLCNHHKY